VSSDNSEIHDRFRVTNYQFYLAIMGSPEITSQVGAASMTERLVKTGCFVVLSLTIVLGLACSALAQSSTAESRATGNSTGNGINDLILVSFILDHERELKLSAQQVQNLAAIRAEFQKQALKKRAELQVAELELDELRAKTPVDLGAVEAKIKQSDALKTELRIDSIKAVEAARAKLSPEQRTKLEALRRANPVSAGQEDSTDPNLQQRVESILKEKYKDQKVVELETSEAIVTKLMDWAKTFGLVLGIPLTILGLALGVLGVKTLSDIKKLADNATQAFATTVETGKQDLANAITAGNQGIANTVNAANNEMVKLASEGQQKVGQLSQEAQLTFDTLKIKGDSYLADYKKIEAQLTEVTALAKKIPTITRNLETLENKVDQIEEKINIDSSNISSKQEEAINSTLKSLQKYFQKIGFNPPKGRIRVRFEDDSEGMGTTASYDPGQNLVQIRSRLVDDLDLTIHSYAHHALMGGKETSLSSASDEVQSIEAGLADYYTCSFTNNPHIAEKSIPIFREEHGADKYPHPYLRNLDNDRSFDEVDPESAGEAELHDIGEIWGGTFWKLRSLLGQEAADKLLFSAWRATDIAAGSGVDFVKKLIELYKPTGDAKNGNRIKSVFKQRGLKL
jgi:Spy/CpxP family protein refolding chaperone